MHKIKDTSVGDDILQTYLGQIKTVPLLCFEEELELSRRIQKGDTEAQKKLVAANLRLVVKLARPYFRTDVAFMDLIQEGNIGLMYAAEKYDHHKMVRFSTYAAWWIRQYIKRFLEKHRRVIRLPHQKEAMLRRIHRSYGTLSQTLMRQPRAAEVAAEAGISLEDMEFILNISGGSLPLEADTSKEESAGIMEIHGDYTYSPEQALLKKSSRDDTLRILNRLKDREKSILTYRYQLNGDEPHTLKKIGDKMGLSAETVRQIELKALRHIRPHAEELRGCLYSG